MSGKLFLQYILDAWVSIEGNRLNWIEKNQKQIRAENYAGLSDFVQRREDQNNNEENQRNTNYDIDGNNIIGTNPGHRFILPSTHPGSTRYYKGYLILCSFIINDESRHIRI